MSSGVLLAHLKEVESDIGPILNKRGHGQLAVGQKVPFPNLNEPTERCHTFSRSVQQLPGQRVEHDVHSTALSLLHQTREEVTVSRAEDVIPRNAKLFDQIHSLILITHRCENLQVVAASSV